MARAEFFLSRAYDHYLNLRGPSIDRKVLVIESDDWGSIRMPSTAAYDRLRSEGLVVDSNPYNRIDSLETEEDLHALYDVLRSYSDHKGRHPVVTANFIVGNPDFARIKSSQFTEFYFELFTETYNRYVHTENSWQAVKQGLHEGLIRAQFHGREHLNGLRWVRLLNAGNQHLLTAFDSGVFCLDVPGIDNRRDNLMASLDFADEVERDFMKTQLQEGLSIFESIFGYSSRSFIAPCNVWDETAEEVLASNGVRYIQSLRGQQVPTTKGARYKRRYLTNGQKSGFGQMYLVRNAYFEPATMPNYPWVNRCLDKIEAAFFWKKPAIISSHRVNFVGSLVPGSRSASLSMLRSLLDAVLKRWPDVEFLSSDELGDLYDLRK